jgi:signal transduction histidine kinase
MLLFSPFFFGLLWLDGGRRAKERWTVSRLQQERPELATVIGAECGWLHHDVLRHGLGGIHATADAMKAGDREAWSWLRGRLTGDDGVLSQLKRFSMTLGVVVAHEVPDSPRGAFPLLEMVEAITRELSHHVDSRVMPPLERARALRSIAARIEEEVCPILVECTRIGESCVVSREWLISLWGRLMEEPKYRRSELRLRVDGSDAGLRVRIPPRDLTSALSNLLRNAADASLASGEKEIRLRVLEVACPTTGEARVHISVGDAAPNGWERVHQITRDPKRGLGLIDAAVGRAGGVVVLSEGMAGWKWATVDLGGAS